MFTNNQGNQLLRIEILFKSLIDTKHVMTQECRICSDEGKYNIFNDELSFDLAQEVKKIKIYIVLNDFLYEKVRKQKFLWRTIILFLTFSFMLLTNTHPLFVMSVALRYAPHTPS